VRYNDTALTENSHYWYQIKAATGGALLGSAETDTLPAVDSLTASAVSTSEIDLAWNLNVTGASAIDVRRWTGPGSTTLTFIESGDATSYHDTALEDNTTYNYAVLAVKDLGYSSVSNIACDTTAAVVATTEKKRGKRKGEKHR
jgi:fibronectin type 3 domain-containing protein